MKPIPNFRSLAYLKKGNSRQRLAWKELDELEMFDLLQDFSPLLAGTLPIEIDVKGSDLDILCEVYQEDEFVELLEQNFANRPGFEIRKKHFQALPSMIASFQGHYFPIEIFAQPKPVLEQQAYLHMIKEWEIMMLMGREFKQQVIRLKEKGFKTEPAFAHLLALKGDPYTAILDWSR